MKRSLAILLAVCMLAALLSGCGAAPAEKDKPQIVTTIFPIYDWTKNLLGDRAEEVDLIMLLDDGVDMHSFQPSVGDMLKMTECDLLIYVGGESDEWIDEALEANPNPKRTALRLMDVLGERALEEELVEGMEGEAEDTPDEHIWLSLKNAALFCAAIRDALTALDGEHARSYEAAYAVYASKLETLDASYQAALDTAPQHTLLVADRFPFRYLVEDYGLDYYAAFSGCSAETEASFATVVFLSDKLNELGLKQICVIETSDGRLADTVIRTAERDDVGVLTLHSMQGAVGGESYLSLMEKNLDVLREALN
ncbi:MAG: zinc ABC transporter substrate-binding protein [Oscillospiraceae bacterium]|nr:zinc ABC transporter substrate-binding protein [Oscillospiraceae bacterium]